MAPFNLENNIREKLENRELKPSPNAWAKLESQLDKKQPKRKTEIWFYAAASFIGAIILSAVFFNETSIDENLKLVDENAKEYHIEKESEIIPKPSFKERTVLVDVDKERRTKKKPSKDDTKFIPPHESAAERQVLKDEVVAKVSENVSEDFSEETISQEESDLLNDKAIEVAANIKSLQNRNSEITMEEVEILLESALRDARLNRAASSNKVDTVVLLAEAEWELDKSLRDKVIDVLGEGFDKLRTAISTRNR